MLLLCMAAGHRRLPLLPQAACRLSARHERVASASLPSLPPALMSHVPAHSTNNTTE